MVTVFALVGCRKLECVPQGSEFGVFHIRGKVQHSATNAPVGELEIYLSTQINIGKQVEAKTSSDGSFELDYHWSYGRISNPPQGCYIQVKTGQDYFAPAYFEDVNQLENGDTVFVTIFVD